MQINNDIFSTGVLPHTYAILNSHLPEIFTCECFNEKNLPFREEVKKTEIAHLFEHILIEYLCAHFIAMYKKRSVVNGVTTWDWYRNPRGSFEITIDTGIKHKELFNKALQQSVILFERVLKSNQKMIN